MSRKQSLRQLVYNCNKELLKSEGLTRTELHDLTNWILNNAAISKITPDELYICEGSYLGVGENNKDRQITIPRFLSYEYGRLDIFSMLNNKSKTFRLKSYKSFDELESFLSYATKEVIVLIDGEIISIEKIGKCNWGYEVIWGCDTYIIHYTDMVEDIEKKEIFRSKLQLQNRLMELVELGAEEIQAYNLIEGEMLDFEVHKRVYSTRPEQVEEVSLIWGKDTQREDVEDSLCF